MIKTYDTAVHEMFEDTLIASTGIMLLDVDGAFGISDLLFVYADMKYGRRIVCDDIHNEYDVRRLAVKLNIQARILYDKYEMLHKLQSNIDVDNVDEILYNRLKIKSGSESDNGSIINSGTDTTETNGNITTDTDKQAYDATVINDTSVSADTTEMKTDITYGKTSTHGNVHGYNVTEKGFTNINLVNGLDQLSRLISSPNFHLFERWFDELINGITLSIYGNW